MLLERMRTATLSVLVFFVSIPCVLAEGRLLDRLVLEVNGKSYTQRQVEVYTLVRAAAMGRGAKDGLIGPDSWQGALEAFAHEALVMVSEGRGEDGEEVTQADPGDVHRVLSELQRLQEEEVSIKNFIKDYRIDDGELRRASEGVVRVQKLLSQKQKSLQSTNMWLSVDTKSQWYGSLKQSIGMRVYDEARIYKRLLERRR